MTMKTYLKLMTAFIVSIVFVQHSGAQVRYNGTGVGICCEPPSYKAIKAENGGLYLGNDYCSLSIDVVPSQLPYLQSERLNTFL